MELWVDITGYNGAYQVSNKSRIRSVDRVISVEYISKLGKKCIRTMTKKGRIILTSYPKKKNYPKTCLCVNGVAKTPTVHRIIATHWIPNPHNLPEVNHKNGNKRDFSLSNLEWVTKSQNSKHAVDKLGRKPPGERLVCQISLDGFLIGEYKSVSEAYRQTGVNFRKISACVNGKVKRASGYIWK